MPQLVELLDKKTSDELHEMIKEVKRGEVYWVDLEDIVLPNTHIQQKSRPAVVIQNNVGNKVAPTVIVALISSVQKREYPMHQNIELYSPSTIMYEQILTIDKRRLKYKMRDLTKEEMFELNRKLGVSLGLCNLMITDIKALKVDKKVMTVTKDKTVIEYFINLFTEYQVYEVILTAEELTKYFNCNLDCENDLEVLEKELNSIRGLNFLSRKLV